MVDALRDDRGAADRGAIALDAAGVTLAANPIVAVTRAMHDALYAEASYDLAK